VADEERRDSWRSRAECRDLPTEWFFTESGSPHREAVAACARCPVRRECLAAALANGDKHGLWGGTSERERRRIRSQLRAQGIVFRFATCAWCGGRFGLLDGDSRKYCPNGLCEIMGDRDYQRAYFRDRSAEAG
jgi:hypothetical protein